MGEGMLGGTLAIGSLIGALVIAGAAFDYKWLIAAVLAGWAGWVLIQHDRLMVAKATGGDRMFIKLMNVQLFLAAVLCGVAYGIGLLGREIWGSF